MNEKKLKEELNAISLSEEEKNSLLNSVLSTKKKNPTVKIAAAVLAVYVVLLNTSSSFALKALQIPVIKQISKILCFNSTYLNAAHRNEILDETGYEFQLNGGTLLIEAIGYDQQSVVVRYVYRDKEQKLSSTSIFLDLVESAGGSSEGSDKGIEKVYNLSQPIDSLTYLTFNAYVDNNDINVSFTISIDKQLIKESVIYPINETIPLNDASIIVESIELNPMNTVVRVHYDYGSYNWIDTNLKLYVDGYPIGLDGSYFREGITEISFDSIYSKDIKTIEIEVTSADAYKSSKSFDLDLSSLTVEGELGELTSVEIQKTSEEYQLIVTSDETLPTELFFFDNEMHVTMSNKTEHRHVYTFASEANKVSVSRNKGIEYPINKKIIVSD